MNLKKIFSFHPLLYVIIFIFLFMLVKNPQNGGLEGLENNNNNELNSLVKEYMKNSSSIQLGLGLLAVTNKIKIPTGISNEIKENKRLKKKLTDILSKQ